MSSMADDMVGFLLGFTDESLESLLGNGHLYNWISIYLRKNGVFRDRLPKEEFPTILFMALKENRESLLVFLRSSPSDSAIISRVANHILKLLNRQFYREDMCRKFERPNTDDMDSFPALEVDEATCMVGLEERLRCLLDREKAFGYRAALEAYFGIGRPYRLKMDSILNVFGIKRSTIFKKIKTIREEINAQG